MIDEILSAMKKISVVLVAVFLSSCSNHEGKQSEQAGKPVLQQKAMEAPSSQQTYKPPPPPSSIPLPGSSFQPIPAEKALEIARQMGPGDCSDLQKIQGLPMAEQHGLDPYYDRIMVHINSYERCLLEATADTTPTRVVASYPGVQIDNVGDLAFVLLGDGGKVSWDECTPANVVEEEKEKGSPAFYAWLDQAGMRKKWHACLMRKHPFKSSSKN